MKVVKAHAFGNDFLLMEESEIAVSVDRSALARSLCERHRGLGADGLITYRGSAFAPGASERSFGETPSLRSGGGTGVRMDLLNADGSYSEVSGNGVRCLAAWIAKATGTRPGGTIDVATDAGVKRHQLLAVEGRRFTFRAAMGRPEQIQQQTIDVDGAPITAVTLRVGNPQCVVLGDVTVERLHAIASKLSVHPIFPEGSNVELACVEAPDRVRILIWERGVGPTEASGTGACAAAVAAMRFGGAGQNVHVVAPGGAQRVEWTDEGLFLTGWAELIVEGTLA